MRSAVPPLIGLLLACGASAAIAHTGDPRRAVTDADDAAAHPDTIAAGTGPGEPQPAAIVHPCRLPIEDAPELLDQTHRVLYETICNAAYWLDGLFGTQADPAAARRTRGYIELSTHYSEFFGTDVRVRLNVQTDLPALRRRVFAFLGRDEEDRFVRDRSESFALRSQFPRLDQRDEWLAGLGYSLPGTYRFQSDFRVGVRGGGNPQLFVRNRFRYNVYADISNLVHWRTTPFWNTRDGLGITTGLDFSRALSETQLVRLGSVLTFSEKTSGMDWYSGLIFYQNLRRQRALAHEIFVRGETDHPVPLREYGSRLLFRYPLVESQLFGDLIVGYSWPKDDPDLPRRGAYGVGVGVEMPFGLR